jgi:hypothetical protein
LVTEIGRKEGRGWEGSKGGKKKGKKKKENSVTR